jgi:glycosyltransferase involved in cell wall biosynthesis
MRKVLLLRTSGNLLGAERVILEAAKHFPSLGYRPIIGVPFEENEPVPVFAKEAEALGYDVTLFSVKSAFDFNVVRTIRNYVAENKIDIIHSHGYREDFYAMFSKTKARLVGTNHLWKRTTFRLKLYAALDGYLLKRFHAIIAVSSAVKDDMLYAGIDEDKITIIANGIDPDNYISSSDTSEIKSTLGIPQDKIVVGTLGSLTVEKGIDIGLKAFAKVKNKAPIGLHLLIVGSGEEMEALKALTKDLGLCNSVTFAGRRDDVSKVLSVMDIFMLPSLNEGLPMALLEAMASESAIVATSVGDVPKVVTPNCGLLVEPGNAEALSNALLKMLTSTDKMQLYAKASRQRVINSFSSLAMAKANATIYDNLFNNKI